MAALVRRSFSEGGYPIDVLKQKTPTKLSGFNKYGSYLLSRILVQYHRP
jgi:hypothetical protein